jgi:hypothetical protein
MARSKLVKDETASSGAFALRVHQAQHIRDPKVDDDSHKSKE